MVDIFIESRYKANRKLVKEQVAGFLKKINAIPERYDLSIAIVGDRKMALINQKFRQKTGTTPVLSFPPGDGPNRGYNHEDGIFLGEIVIAYPQVILLAADENKKVDTKICELVEHGLTQLITTD